jgi:glyoxylase-like metal-dependent hydrolase (beta-lactamase superfamily II)
LRVDGGDHIDRLVNTHANPDHFVGNGLVEGAEIIATVETAREMGGFDPVRFASLADNWQAMGDAGAFLYETMGRKFDWSDLILSPCPTVPSKSVAAERRRYRGRADRPWPGAYRLRPIAWLPQQRVVFTGDLLFNEGHPIMWDGPIENWIAACEHIIALDPEVVVPGHGPITDTVAVANLRDYFRYVRDEARRRFEAGMGWKEAGATSTWPSIAAGPIRSASWPTFSRCTGSGGTARAGGRGRPVRGNGPLCPRTGWARRVWP